MCHSGVARADNTYANIFHINCSQETHSVNDLFCPVFNANISSFHLDVNALRITLNVLIKGRVAAIIIVNRND